MQHEILELCELGLSGNPLQAERALRRIQDACQADDGVNLFNRASAGCGPAPGFVVQPIEAPTRILVVPDLPSVAASGSSQAISINFQGPGFGELIGMQGAVVDSTTRAVAELELMEVEISLNTKNQITTDGESVAGGNFGVLFRDTPFYFPLRRLISSNDRMFFTFNNLDPANALTPILHLFFKSEEDLALDAARNKRQRQRG